MEDVEIDLRPRELATGMPKFVKRVGPGKRLEGKRVVFFVAQEFEDIELFYPVYRLSEEGAEVVVVAVNVGSHPRPQLFEVKPVTGRYGMVVSPGSERFAVKSLDEVKPDDFDAVVLPGGFSPDRLRRIDKILEFVKAMNEQGKVIAAICHGPQILISAHVIKGKKCTGTKAIKDDLINAGCEYVDQPAVRDGNFIMARGPDDLPEFCQLIIDALST